MPEFDAAPIREHDASGRLIAAGAEWNEPRVLVQESVFAVAVIVVLAAIAGCVGAVAADEKSVWLLVLAGSIGVLAGLRRVWKRAWRRRSLVFRKDGSMPMPHGLPHFPRNRHVGGDHAWIGSIEVKARPCQQHEVVLYCAGGDVVTVATRLDEWRAHKVAVLLTTALGAMRESLANAGQAGQAAAEAPTPKRRRALID